MKHLALAIVVFTLAACGGGGGGGEDGTAEGLWLGTSDTGRANSGLVLDDGTFWFIYSAQFDHAVTAGFIQGNGTSSSGRFTSSNGRLFNFEGSGDLAQFRSAGTYKAMSSFRFALTFPDGARVSVKTSYDSQYDLTPSLTAIAGTYSGQAINSAGSKSTTVIISSTGTINGNGASGCTFTGNASTRANGNVYNVTITFGGGACANGTSTVTGVAYFDASTKQFTSAAINSTRTEGFIYIGTKP